MALCISHSVSTFSRGIVTIFRLQAPLQACQYVASQQQSRVLYSTDAFSKPPKRPLNAYLKFSVAKRGEVRAANPGLKITDHSKIIGRLWADLNSEEKERSIRECAEEMDAWTEKYKTYREHLPEEFVEKQKLLRQEKKEKKEKLKLKNKLKQMDRPKQPRTAFTMLVQEQDFLRLAATEAMKVAGKRWTAMTDEEKEPYLSKYRENKLLYEEEMSQWEEEMFASGHEDLVRKATLRKMKNTK